MSRSNRQYKLTWVVLIILIISTAILVVLSILTQFSYPLISALSGLLIIASGIFLFLKASEFSLQSIQEESGTEEENKSSARIKNKEEKSELEQLDIHGVAKKIVRRVNTADDAENWGKQLLAILVTEIELMSGIFYYKNKEELYISGGTFGYPHSQEPASFKEGEGLTGQAVKNGQVVIYRNIPDTYSNVFSGLGCGKPAYLAIIPIIVDDEGIAVIEVAGFRHAEENLEQLFQVVSRELAQKIKEAATEASGNDVLAGNTTSDKNDSSGNGIAKDSG